MEKEKTTFHSRGVGHDQENLGIDNSHCRFRHGNSGGDQGQTQKREEK